ncbi:MAG: dihydroorotate dehydrogenase electron transfer subunit [Magnetococcales bacterium]|nr:dihydroorotate dehydrogenase electron transfer subunit [Magnetococcales bacterium]
MCQPVTSHQTKATVLFNQQLTKTQFLLRLQASDGIKEAKPGHFIHLNCHPSLTLPRPFSILDTDIKQGTLDVFYQVVGEGTQHMAGWQAGFETTMLSPIGCHFTKPDSDQNALLIAGGIGYAPLDFFARELKKQGVKTTLLLGIESDPPFELTSSSTPLLSYDPIKNPLSISRQEAMGIPSRLSSLEEKPGFYKGYVTQLAAKILQKMDTKECENTRLYVCGPTPMMKAAALVASQFKIGGQVSLEEHMACGFGGCAGCVAPIRDADDSWNYRRVCTDGPVFDLNDVVWEKI